MALDDGRLPPFVMGKRWFLVYTRPKSEVKAALNLRAQEFRTFLPQIQKTVRHARQLRTARAPLFPRYVFVELDLGRDRWLSVRSTFGVASLFTSSEGHPVPVPRGVVENLLQQSDGDQIRLGADLRAGQRVRLLSGPFADLIGKIERLDGSERVRVLLELMSTPVPIAVDRTAVVPVG
jgi:transcriptional antiterminator RfaH